MDPRLLRHYNRELQYLRETGSEFASEFPKIAARLGLEGLECADPYVERLLEGFAFMAARVQVKLDSEFPRFTQHLLSTVHPHYLSPTPSMAMVRIEPDLTDAGLADGFEIPRDTALYSQVGPPDRIACEFRTSHALTLWPIEVAQADYISSTGAVANLGIRNLNGAKAAIRVRLRCTAGLTFDALSLDSLPVFVQGTEDVPVHIFEQLLGNNLGAIVRKTDGTEIGRLNALDIARAGFSDAEAILPYSLASFQGYRLLHEYFCLPQRFMYAKLENLAPHLARCNASELELVFLLDRSDSLLHGVVNEHNFALFCTPAINLFKKRADRIHLNQALHEYHVVADRARPMDFEIYNLQKVVGYGTGRDSERTFEPLYTSRDLGDQSQTGRAYYATRRELRRLSARQKIDGPRSSYIGSEVFLALVDLDQAPYSGDLRQLAVDVFATNRDLPLFMSTGRGGYDFRIDSGGPIAGVRCLVGPTRPRPAWIDGAATWRVISHLTLNYLSLVDDDDGNPQALRDLLGLYANLAEPVVARQIEDLRSVNASAVTRRMPVPGPISFGRGLEITVTFDEAAYQGTGIFVLGAVLDEFFRRYVSLNSFTETVVSSTDRGEVMRWPAKIGTRHLL